MRIVVGCILGLLFALAHAACGDPQYGTTGAATTTGTGESGGAGGAFDPCVDTNLPEEDLGAGSDPEDGSFTLDEALAGLPEGPGPLRAILSTDLGIVSCELFPEVAPNGVANFVGLARGRRPFDDAKTKRWIRGRRFYDGLLFHRVIDDFVAQGGDPLGTGYGGPGYEFADEIGALSHVPGALAYANSGPDSNGSQFYIVAEESAGFLDGGYVIFGQCWIDVLIATVNREQPPISVVQALTEVPTDADDAPVEPLRMNAIEITRCAR